MSRRSTLALLATVALAVPLSAQTIDEIVAKNIEAHGGAQKLSSVQSRRMTGKVSLPNGLELKYVQTNKRPNKVREDYTVQGLVVEQSYDGKNAWQIDPTQGKRTPEALGEEDTRALIEDSQFDGALIGYKDRGATAELVGKDDVDGSPAYKIVVREKNGDTRTLYLDEDAYLEIKMEIKRVIRGAEREYELTIGDYKNDSGVMLPYSIESKPKGAPQGQKVTFDLIESNPKVDDSFFAEPTVTPATAPAPAAEVPAKAPSKTPAKKKPPVA
jgi:outer membrane lipoprotein-sorting protein